MHEPIELAEFAGALDEHRLALERLARRLVGLGDEDAAQDTFLTALKGRTAHGPGWFTTVARRASRRREREALARRWREARAARGEATAASDESAERAEVAQRVLAAVLALDEPYRGVTLLRHFDDLTPTEIGARTGRPPATVRQQLARAHALLRVKLGAVANEDEGWLLALAPLVAGAPRRSLPATGIAAAVAAVSLATVGVMLSTPGTRHSSTEAAPERSTDAHGALAAADARDADPTSIAEPPGLPRATAAAHGTTGSSSGTASDATGDVDGQAALEFATLRGRVVDEQGQAIANAAVDFGYTATRSAKDGTFELRVPAHELDDDPPLTAWRKGLGAAVRAGLAAEARTGGAVSGIVLVLPSNFDVARGRVVDGDGRGLAGWSVALANGTRHGSWGTPLEYAVGGVSGLAVTTDEHGDFALGGLLEREYRLRALAPDEGVVLEGDVGPGSWHVTLVRTADALAPRVTGRVVDLHGVPIAQAEVAIETMVVDVGFSGVLEVTHRTLTDATGGFVLLDVPRSHVTLVVEGDEAMRTERTIEEHLAHPELDLSAERRYRFQIEAGDHGGATHARVLDAAGHELTLEFHLPDLQARRPLMPLTGPGTPVVVRVPAGAHTLVLEREGREVRRCPLVLEPLKVNVVTP